VYECPEAVEIPALTQARGMVCVLLLLLGKCDAREMVHLGILSPVGYFEEGSTEVVRALYEECN